MCESKNRVREQVKGLARGKASTASAGKKRHKVGGVTHPEVAWAISQTRALDSSSLLADDHPACAPLARRFCAPFR
jgi:hypothetical protein